MFASGGPVPSHKTFLNRTQKKFCVKHVQNQESRKNAHIFFFGINENIESSVNLTVTRSMIPD